MSHSAEKCKRGTLFDFQTCILLQNNKKLKGGTLWGQKKIFEKKVAQCRKKIKRGDPLASAGFVGYVEKVKNERGDPLDTKNFRKKVAQCRKKRKKIERGTL